MLEGVPLRMVSQAASRRNVTVVLSDRDVAAAMTRLHDAAFDASEPAGYGPMTAAAGRAAACCCSDADGWAGSSSRSSGEYGFDVAGWVDRRERPAARRTGPTPTSRSTSRRGDAVAVELSGISPARGLAVVIGTTGWAAHEAAIRREAEARGIGVVAAPNFALGVSLFGAIVARAAELMSRRTEFGAWVHELHHAAKRDAPSGTALALLEIMRGAGYTCVDRRLVRRGRARFPARTRSASTAAARPSR